jgi:hypothetical protein
LTSNHQIPYGYIKEPDMAIKNKSSLWTLMFPLLVAFIVVGVVLVYATGKKINTDTRSHASAESALRQCTNACTDPRYKNIIKDGGACSLSCQKVTTGALSCSDFCAQNVQNAGTKLCLQMCESWQQTTTAKTNRCDKVCPKAEGIQAGDYEIQRQRCLVDCNDVENGKKKCSQAFATSKNTGGNTMAGVYLAECQKQFAK